jgi:hypothetical protein
VQGGGLKNLTTAIFGKCVEGTDLHADIGGRLFKGRAPEGTEYPYVVFMLISDVPENTFSEDLDDVVIQFSLFSLVSSSAEVEDMFTHLKAIYDDCSLTISGSSLIWMKRQVAQLMAEEHTTPSGTVEAWHYAVDYSILLEKV